MANRGANSDWPYCGYAIYNISRPLYIRENMTASTRFDSGPAILIQNIARLKFSKLAKTMFSFKENEIALLEAELKAPGNELAYISKIKTQFGD